MLMRSTLVWNVRCCRCMKIHAWIRHGFIISVLYAIGLVELHYLPRYGLEYFLGAIGLTAFTAGFWMRTHWDV